MTDPIAATTTQTILGANGVIARELSRCLCESAQRIRQVSRNPRRINEGDKTFAADLLDPQATADAVAGSETAYLVAGLKYDAAVWVVQWPMPGVGPGMCRPRRSR